MIRALFDLAVFITALGVGLHYGYIFGQRMLFEQIVRGVNEHIKKNGGKGNANE